MQTLTERHRDYERIEAAIRFIEQHALEHPTLEDLATHLGLSAGYTQRLFTRWAGISPKRFLQHLTVSHAKQLLRDSASVLDAALASGLSGPGRLHDLLVNIDAVTPGEYKQLGDGLEIVYGFRPTPFGICLLAETSRGICFLGFVDRQDRDVVMAALRREWPKASLREDSARVAMTVDRVFSPTARTEQPLRVLLHGTNFQIKVWQALLHLPAGKATTYQDLARAMGQSKASRAVGNAIGQNPVAYLIPCHRVLRTGGALGGYRWGTTRKRAILAMEAARTSP